MDLTRRALTWLLVATSGYVACSLMANVMSVRILRIGPEWASFSVDAGTLSYPLTFTLRDLVHKIGGRSAARVVILSAATLNVVLAVGLWLAAQLPADAEVTTPAQEWFGPVLNPVTRIVIASVFAQVIAELADTEVYHRFVMRFGRRIQWGRVLTSNLVAIPIDSILFVAIAFGGDVPLSVALSIVWANVAVKGLATVASVGLIYVVPDGLSRQPQ